MNATRKQLERQFENVVQRGWLPWFQREARRGGTTTAHVLGLGSRETNLENIRGDFRNGKYNGFGVMQVDIGTDPVYARNWTKALAEPSIIRGVDIYLSKVRDTRNSVGKRVQVRSRHFIGAAVAEDDLRRIATAAYNCGRWAYFHFSNRHHVDSTTTGKDYSRDVYDRAVEFADILEERGYEQMAIANELTLQGKYARSEHRKIFTFDVPQERLKANFGPEMEAPEELEAADYERGYLDPFADLRTGDLLDVSTSTAVPSERPAEIPDLIADQRPIIATPSVPPHSTNEPPSTQSGSESGATTELTSTQTVETPEGEKTHSATVTQLPGDEPDAAPSHWLELRDWRPFASRWLKRVGGAFSGLNVTQFSGLSFAGITDASNWYIYVGVAVGILILLLIAAAVIAIPLIALWFFSDRKVANAKTEVGRSLVDPNMKNLGLRIITV
jgi:hypothetical protein